MSRPETTCVRQHLSEARFGTYLAACCHDPEHALRLYEWNAAVSAAFWEIIGHLEVGVRNTMDNQLARRHSNQGRDAPWTFDRWPELAKNQQTKLDEARRNATKGARPLAHGRIVAELSFGFWRFLVTKQHNHLWPDLATGLPCMPRRDRSLIEQPLKALHLLRNRIAHHEPLLTADLGSRHQQLIRVLGYIDPQLREWVDSVDRVPALLTDRPAQ